MSTLLEQASLVLIPSGYKEDKVYSVVPSNGSGDLSFTRASDGTRINSDGLVEVCPWNLVQQSNTFNTTWATSNATLTSGQAGYDGSINAWLLTTTLAGGFIFQSVAINGVTTLSIYAKAGSQNGIILYSAHTAQGRNFNLSTGTIGASFVAAPLDSIIQSIGSGWYRCSITISSSSTNNFRIYISDGTNPSVGNAIIQNSQVNIGSTVKPYFPTTDRLNVPRLTYQNGGGGCPSLLLEPQRTNMVTYSEQFDNIAWTKTQSTITANSVVSPDGYTNADKLVEGSGSVQPTVLVNFGVLTTTLSQSVYAKAGERSVLALGSNTTDNTNAYAIFDLTNGVCKALTSAKLASFSITSVGNGWYRCTVNFIASTSTAGHRFVIAVGNDYNASFSSSLSPLPAYTGNGSSGIYIWGAQLELASYSSSYIPTVASSATRIADACSKTGISSLIGQTEGTLFVEAEYVREGATSNARKLISVNDGSSANLVDIYVPSGQNTLTARVRAGAVGLGSIVTSSVPLGRVKIAYAYKANDYVLYINGTQIGVVTTGGTLTFSSAVTIAQIGDGEAAADELGGSIGQAILFKTRLTNSELAQITTI